ncbi:MAG: hypothetical protein PHE71_03155 [Candidatus Shapirobacteria bacterium]|nr:hypothetical protein [Candidatus Shapirobacteria bacterium]
MAETEASFSKIRKIDNSRQWLPFWTTLLLVFLIVLAVWFFKGGSFKLYASIFFSIYSVTQQIWISVILMGIIQNIIFLPLRLIGNSFDKSLKDFEDELDKIEKEENQSIIFNKKLKEGSLPIVFYIFNFFVNAIAFFSAGRIFLIDFYSDPLKLQKMKLLYDFVPYPKYPLKGINLHVPLFKITQTMALDWNNIFMIVGFTLLFFVALRLLWRVLRIFLGHNKKVLFARIKYNRLLFTISGFGGVAIILIVILLRHIPTAFQYFVFIANLSRQNTPMNFTTAVGTFIVTIHAGYKNNSEAAKKAELANIPKEVIKKVFKGKMEQSLKNAVVLGLGAFFITNNIPSAFELSVTTFEVMYMIYPYTFGLLIKKTNQPTPPPSTPAELIIAEKIS